MSSFHSAEKMQHRISFKFTISILHPKRKLFSVANLSVWEILVIARLTFTGVTLQLRAYKRPAGGSLGNIGRCGFS